MIKIRFKKDLSTAPEWFEGDTRLSNLEGPYIALARVNPHAFTFFFRHCWNSWVYPLIYSKQVVWQKFEFFRQSEVNLHQSFSDGTSLKLLRSDLELWYPDEYFSWCVGQANKFDITAIPEDEIRRILGSWRNG